MPPFAEDKTRIGPDAPNSHTSGPFADDRTTVGGRKGSQNTDPDAAPNRPSKRRGSEDRNYEEEEKFTEAANEQNQPPVTHDSPWKLHFPAWRTVVLGGSGGIYRDPHTHLEG